MTAGSTRGGTMDPEKPFKTIEVIDSRTSQVCKVACMSCIRGHRTTSCGIPVCRNKIFWTVKRPGRPSNSCTCRYGATGGCKCVVARTACPHKSKSRKGEKRSGECRCDEQGRFCCLLEKEHWGTLIALRKPTVDFYPSRDILEARQPFANASQGPRTPPLTVGDPHMDSGQINGTLVYQPGYSPTISLPPTPYGIYNPSQTTVTTRFGLLGVGAPQGLPENSTPDVLTWQGEAPQAPRDWHPAAIPMYPPSEQSPCCQGPASATTPSLQSGAISLSNPFELSTSSPYTPETDSFTAPSSIIPDRLLKDPMSHEYERFQMQFNRQQPPSAICQSCGLGGCSCRNCPPVFQNPNDTSWGQGCGRKHARETPSRHISEPMNKVARLRPEHIAATGNMNSTYVSLPPSALGLYVDERQQPAPKNPQLSNVHATPTEKYLGFEGAPPDLIFFGLENHPHELDVSEYLVSDLDRSDRQRERGESENNCCCGGS